MKAGFKWKRFARPELDTLPKTFRLTQEHRSIIEAVDRYKLLSSAHIIKLFCQIRYAGLVSVRRNGQQMIYAAAYDGMQRLMGFLTENCCQLDARGCSSDCPQPLPTRKKQKRTRQKVRAA